MVFFNRQGLALTLTLIAAAVLAGGVFGGAAFAQTQTAKKETAAVYVYGSHPRQETIKEAVTAYMIKIKKYRMIDLEAIDPALAEMQRQDNVATDQIAQFGFDKGAKWLCFVKLTLDKGSGETVIRITMVETQSKEATDTDIKVLPRGISMDEMLDFIKKMIRDMLSVNDESDKGDDALASSSPSGGGSGSASYSSSGGSGYTGGSYTGGGSGSGYTSANNQPSKPVIYDYTDSERWKAILLNLLVPGFNIGTYQVDNAGIAATTMFLLGVPGLTFTILGLAIDDDISTGFIWAGAGCLGFNFLLNAATVLIAHKPDSVRASVPSDGLNFAVFPSDINGGLKGYVSYSASF
jgi:uncharacterized membrane protein YgcG